MFDICFERYLAIFGDIIYDDMWRRKCSPLKQEICRPKNIVKYCNLSPNGKMNMFLYMIFSALCHEWTKYALKNTDLKSYCANLLKATNLVLSFCFVTTYFNQTISNKKHKSSQSKSWAHIFLENSASSCRKKECGILAFQDKNNYIAWFWISFLVVY